jgi:hypothetical protein
VWGDGGAYAAWTAFLQRWGADLRVGDEPLPSLAREDFQPDTWVRLTNHLVDAVNGRFRLWGTALTADIGRAESEFAAGRALANARVGLLSVLRLVQHPSLPPDLREQLTGMAGQQISSLQDSLERQMDRMAAGAGGRAAVEARRRTLRENPLTAVLSPPTPVGPAPPTAAAPAADPWAFDPTARSRRTLAVD